MTTAALYVGERPLPDIGCAMRINYRRRFPALSRHMLGHIEFAARAVDMEIHPIMLGPGEEFDAAFEVMHRKQAWHRSPHHRPAD
jgi:hypothetical protein